MNMEGRERRENMQMNDLLRLRAFSGMLPSAGSISLI